MTGASDMDWCISIQSVSSAISEASSTTGFFYIRNHGISEDLQNFLFETAQQFFELPLDEKRRIAMIHGGKAWRGYFSVGDELTSGIPDQKEGIYFGTENATSNLPLHGSNLWPEGNLGIAMKQHVLEYMRRFTEPFVK